MNQYITGSAIKQSREKAGLTQSELADIVGVTDKAVSRWETGKGYPDITLLEPIASALGTSVQVLLSGNAIINTNQSGNIARSKIYVCPICGNVIFSAGETTAICCGIQLKPITADNCDEIIIEPVEDEIMVSVDHPMSKDHYISFIALVASERFELIKLYPEGECSARFKKRGHAYIYTYCNKHGLSQKRI